MNKVLPLLLLMTGVPLAQTRITPPDVFLGFPVGADRQLADWQQITSYFRDLDEESERVLVREVGRSTEGNPFLLVTISAPENLARLEHYRQVQNRLADPRRVTGSPEELIAEGKTIVLVTCGIHSTEVASPQMSLEFAWEMARATDRETLEILENVIFLFVPALNPDGVNIVVNWYRDTVGTAAEGTRPPRLYHKYAGHDNNRDWYMFTQAETRIAIEQIQNRWHPQIVYDVHQMSSTAARIFVPPFVDPIDPNVDPLLQAQILDIGGFMFSALVAAGRKGVVTNAIYDAWTPARAYQHYHGGVRLLSESASARLATPVRIDPEQLGQGRNYHAARASWNFPQPWPGGWWRLRDIVDDQKIALKACLLHAARNRSHWLSNFFQIGRRSLGREDPYAFVIPDGQPDAQSLYDLLETLDFGLVEIHRAGRATRLEDVACSSPPFCGPAADPQVRPGDFVVLMQQPYSSFARTLLEIQHYPELRRYPGGPLLRPYDVTAHTLGTQLGVTVYRVGRPFEASLDRVDPLVRPSGSVSGSGGYWLFSHQDNGFAKLANRLLRKGYRVDWATYGFRIEGHPYPAGTLMARAGQGSVRELGELLQDVPIQVRRTSRWPQLAWQRIREPALGLYQSYQASMDEGWTRWVLEQNDFSYTTLLDADMREGSLDRFDAVLFADQAAVEIREGLSEPYPAKYRGGIGTPGIENLKRFAEQGGTLIFLGNSALLAAEAWPLGIRETTPHPNREFFVPGSLLALRVNRGHPVGYGMPERSAAMFVRGPVLETERAVLIASYPESDLLLSGWMDGEEVLAGKPAVFEVPMGQGRIVVIAFRSQFRAQTRGTYKLLFNSLFYATTQ